MTKIIKAARILKTNFKMKLFLLLLFTSCSCFAQWTPAPADCPNAMRICDVTKTYKFQLVDDGLLDDAHGKLYIYLLGNSSLNKFESKSAWIKFKPQYSGQFGLNICPETVENYNFIIFKNPQCGDIEEGAYQFVTVSNAYQIPPTEPIHGCTGLGFEPYTGEMLAPDWKPYINIEAGNEYLLFVTTSFFTNVGTHRFSLQFTGSVVAQHPDLFSIPNCNGIAEPPVTPEVSNEVVVYPNPFTNELQIVTGRKFISMDLYDVLGKLIISKQFSSSLDTSSLANGMYFLNLYAEDGGVVVKKVFKVK